MTTALVVSIHPEPRSFTAQWAEASARAAAALGWEVLRSDPYAEGFDPAMRAEQFAGWEGPFDPLKAMERCPMAGDVAAEVERIRAADLLILHFPMWWFGPPAMLKGWTDRALVHGALHDVDRRFDTGICRGKRVLFCVTTGSKAEESGPDGKEGDYRLLLWPLAYTFRYCGFDIHAPVAVHGVHGYHRDARKTALEARLTGVLAGQEALLGALGDRPLMRFNADSDFGADGRLKPDAPSFSPFIRQP